MIQNVQRNKDYCDRLWHVWAQQFGAKVPVEVLTKQQKRQITAQVDNEFGITNHEGRAFRSRLKNKYDRHYMKLVTPFMNEPKVLKSNPVALAMTASAT